MFEKEKSDEKKEYAASACAACEAALPRKISVSLHAGRALHVGMHL